MRTDNGSPWQDAEGSDAGDGRGSPKTKVDALESAIFTRCLELQQSSEGHAERFDIEKATKSLLKLKVEKLGFPINSSIDLPNSSLPPENRSKDSGS